MPGEAPESNGASETPDDAAVQSAAESAPGAHGGALFDWARQIPEWRAPAAEPAARRRPPQAAARPPHAAVRPRAAAPQRSTAVEVWHHRLTRRGRIVALAAASVLATAVLAGLIVTVASAGAAASGAPTASALAERPATVVVRDGDTLWAIAKRVRPGDDPRSTVHEIVRVNGLTEPELVPGQELVLPDF